MIQGPSNNSKRNFYADSFGQSLSRNLTEFGALLESVYVAQQEDRVLTFSATMSDCSNRGSGVVGQRPVEQRA